MPPGDEQHPAQNPPEHRCAVTTRIDSGRAPGPAGRLPSPEQPPSIHELASGPVSRPSRIARWRALSIQRTVHRGQFIDRGNHKRAHGRPSRSESGRHPESTRDVLSLAAAAAAAGGEGRRGRAPLRRRHRGGRGERRFGPPGRNRSADSPLVKTAIAGADANRGRVVMAVGRRANRPTATARDLRRPASRGGERRCAHGERRGKGLRLYGGPGYRHPGRHRAGERQGDGVDTRPHQGMSRSTAITAADAPRTTRCAKLVLSLTVAIRPSSRRGAWAMSTDRNFR